MENIIRKLNEIVEDPLMEQEFKALCKAYALEVVRYFEARNRVRQGLDETFRGD